MDKKTCDKAVAIIKRRKIESKEKLDMAIRMLNDELEKIKSITIER